MNRLPELLEVFNLLGKELAEKSGIRPTRVSALALGRDLASPQELDALTAALGVAPERIYDEPFLRAIEAARTRVLSAA